LIGARAAALAAGLIASAICHGGNPPAADHASGFFAAPFTLKLSAPDPDAEIRYTLDGSRPNPTNGTAYRQPIPVQSTTVLRAAVFGKEVAPFEALARTFLFTRQVPHQTGGPLPPAWGGTPDHPARAWYGMVPTANALGTEELEPALHALPSLSVLADPADLFGAEAGLYTHPRERGRSWERPIVVEWLDPGNAAARQMTCGLRIHGGTSRDPEESPKHSFRLVFRHRYGAEKAGLPGFSAPGAPRTRDLVLRAGNNDSWLAADGPSRREADYLRDEWGRRTLADMGYPSAAGCFVHLYLNGLYWGLYNLCERPEESLFAAPGTDNVDYDLRKGDQIESGDNAAWDRLAGQLAHLADGHATFEAIAQALDTTQFADYLLLNLYGGNADWDRSANWVAYRPRLPGGRFRFLVWDAEGMLRSPDADITHLTDEESPMGWFHALCGSSEFRRLVGERAQRLFAPGGPLSPDATARRYRELARAVRPAIPAEAARWGAYRRDVHPYRTGPFEAFSREKDWDPRVERVLRSFFPGRNQIVMGQLDALGLVTAPAPPARQP